MKNIAIIPARSGSKGLKDKNIMKLHGKTLIQYSVDAAKESKMFDCIHVSTDSEWYSDIALKCGADQPFLRSKETSTDQAGSWEVVREVLHNYRNLGKIFDTICLLQPTSPLRKSEDIVKAYEFLKNKGDAVTSVCEVDHSPLWCMTLEDDLSLKNFRENLLDSPRQHLSTYYRVNGAIYIRKIEYGEDLIQILDVNEYAYIMPRERSVDIDTQLDFDYARFLLERKN